MPPTLACQYLSLDHNRRVNNAQWSNVRHVVPPLPLLWLKMIVHIRSSGPSFPSCSIPLTRPTNPTTNFLHIFTFGTTQRVHTCQEVRWDITTVQSHSHVSSSIITTTHIHTYIHTHTPVLILVFSCCRFTFSLFGCTNHTGTHILTPKKSSSLSGHFCTAR